MDLRICYADEADSDACALCGKRILATPGPHLFHGSTGGIVCRTCGTKHAPPLAALLDLAKVAERVSRVCRHTLIPPLETLLDLARAAEEYNVRAPEAVASE